MGVLNKVITGVVLAYAAIVSVWCSALGGSLFGAVNHDEHQFMASAYMVARHGLQPYRDFAYFHMPNLVYLYAPLFFLPYPFLAARLFSAFCAFGICLILFATARGLFKQSRGLNALIVPAGAVLLLIHSRLFQIAASSAWNHMPATICAMLGFSFYCRAVRSNKALPWLFLSGFAIGMAVGIRISFVPVVVPFLLTIVICGSTTAKDKLFQLLAFALGGLLANLPAIYFCLTNYEQFVFGNLGYPKLGLAYRKEISHAVAMTFLGKMELLVQSVFAQPGDLLILLFASYSLIICGIEMRRRSVRPRREIQLLLLVLIFVFIGCVVPTPGFDQYYFALVPFLLLLAIYALSELRPRFAEAASLSLVASAFFSTIFSSPLNNIGPIDRFLRPSSWVPMQVHAEAQWIRNQLNGGPNTTVLTLSPIYAIESGLSIYKEFVTGPFAWRVSHLLPEEQAKARGLPSSSETATLFEERRPDAVLVGKEEKRWELPLIQEAQQRGYQPVTTPAGSVLWESPK